MNYDLQAEFEKTDIMQVERITDLSKIVLNTQTSDPFIRYMSCLVLYHASRKSLNLEKGVSDLDFALFEKELLEQMEKAKNDL